MIAFDFKIESFVPQRVERPVNDGSFRSLGHAAASIRKDAVASIQPGEGPSAAGTPPHTHTQTLTKKGKTKKGHLPRSIAYAVDKSRQEAVIGPRASVVGEAGAAHELGETYMGDDYEERPFMGPALERAIPRLPGEFTGSIGG